MAKSVGSALSKYQKTLKRVRKEHPKMSFKAAQDRASKLYKSEVSGKKKTATVGKKAKKKSVTKTVKIATVGAAPKRKSGGSPVNKGVAVAKHIEGLTVLLRNTKGTPAKNAIKRRINAEHDKLDALAKHF